MVCAPPPHLSMSAPGSPISNFFPPRGARLSQASLHLRALCLLATRTALPCHGAELSTSQRYPRPAIPSRPPRPSEIRVGALSTSSTDQVDTCCKLADACFDSGLRFRGGTRGPGCHCWHRNRRGSARIHHWQAATPGSLAAASEAPGRGWFWRPCATPEGL